MMARVIDSGVQLLCDGQRPIVNAETQMREG